MSHPEVFVGNIPMRTTHDDIDRFFKEKGIPEPSQVRINKRFAFVRLKTKADADLTVQKLHGSQFLGEVLRVELGKNASSNKDKDVKRLDRNSGPSHGRSSDNRNRKTSYSDDRNRGFHGGSSRPMPDADHRMGRSNDFHRPDDFYPGPRGVDKYAPQFSNDRDRGGPSAHVRSYAPPKNDGYARDRYSPIGGRHAGYQGNPTGAFPRDAPMPGGYDMRRGYDGPENSLAAGQERYGLRGCGFAGSDRGIVVDRPFPHGPNLSSEYYRQPYAHR